MKIRAIISALLFGTLSVAVSHVSLAQNAVGGAPKTKPNIVGGVAKPAPALGGAAKSTAGFTKPATVGGVTKQGSAIGTSTTGLTGNATSLGGSTAKPNPPVTPPNKGGTVVTTTSNLKCGGGACVARGTKP
jgi:hypothetical protein